MKKGAGAGIARCSLKENAGAAIPGDVKAIIADAASRRAMNEAADRIIERYGRIDGCYGAGMTARGLPRGEFIVRIGKYYA